MRRRDDGASMVLTSMMIVALLTAVSAGVDMGRLSVAANDAQHAADIASMDAMWVLDGSTTTAIEAAAVAAAEASAARNGFADGVTAEVGTVVAGVFTPTTGTEVPDSVRVSIDERVDRLFRPGTDATRRRAVSTRTGLAGFWVGSRIASLDTDEAAVLDAVFTDGFNPLTPITLTIGDYEGLANVGVAPDGLADGLAVGSPDELVLMGETGVDELLGGMATALSNDGHHAESTMVGYLAANADGSRTVDPAALFTFAEGGATATEDIDVLGLLTGLAMAAVQDDPIAIPVTGGIPGVAGLTLDLRVISPPHYAYGPVGTTARSAQVDLHIVADLSLPGVLVGVGIAGQVVIDVELGSMIGTSAAITCGSPKTVSIDADPRLVHAGLDLDLIVSTTILALTTDVLAIDASAAVDLDSPAQLLEWDEAELGTRRAIGSRTVGFGDNVHLTVDEITVLGALPGPQETVVDTVIDAVEPTLEAIDIATVGVLADALGMRFGGGVVTATEIDCNAPRLVG